jgi:hypothetical protein
MAVLASQLLPMDKQKEDYGVLATVSPDESRATEHYSTMCWGDVTLALL